MANYKFTSVSGIPVDIRTEINEDFYFGIFVTVEGHGENRWATLEKRNGETFLAAHAIPNHSAIHINLPEDIASQIESEKNAACRNTGKIIVATAKNEIGEVQFTKYCTAIAEPLFKGTIWYRVSENLENFIRAQAKNGEIFDMGSVEEEANKCNDLIVDTISQYQFVTEHDPAFAVFGFTLKEAWTLTLRVENLKD